MEYIIGYSSKTFSGIITAGVLTVEADDIQTVKEEAFNIVMKHYKDNADEDEDWYNNIQNLSVSVTEASDK